jgi:hypothetical protein
MTVFEKRVMEKVLWCMRKARSGGWREVHNEEIHDLYSSPLIRTEHVARAWRGGWHTRIWWRFLRERENLEDLGGYRKIILK